MAAAAPFAPMLIGAGLGAVMNRSNPLAGAALGAVGGAVAGPALGALGGAGGAAGAARGAAGAAGNLAPVVTAGVNSGGTILAGMNQAAPLFTSPLARGLDALSALGSGPGANAMKFGMNALSAGRQQPQQQPMMAPPPPAAPPPPQQAGPIGSFAALSPYARRRGLIG
jgi:hypothetical protein